MTDTVGAATSFEQSLSAKAPSGDSMADLMTFRKVTIDDASTQDEHHVCNRQKISALIFLCHLRPSLTIDSMKKWGKKIVALSKASGGSIKLNVAHDLVANALGYKSYLRATELRGGDDVVTNLWHAEGARGQHLLTINGGWPSEKPSEDFEQRKAFNKQRAFASRQKKIERRRLKNIERHLRKSSG